jgi:polyhydroxyalkanoate synthase
MMRSGPKPLPFQLGMASLASAGLAGGTAFDAQTLQDFFRGIQKYQAHEFKRNVAPLETIWSAGQARLLCAPGIKPDYVVPVVLVPSMVNKSDILDLLPEKSLLRWLSVQGFASHLFDWGTPTDDAGQADFDKAIAERLLPAIESLGGPVILVGYCMGGLFTAAVSALRPELVRAQIMLATPWNFHDEAGYLRNRLTIMNPMAQTYMQQYSRLPDTWMQTVFATLDPEGSIKKFSGFARIDDEAKERMFVAVEDWVNEGVDLPSGIAKMCLTNWYQDNEPYNGAWNVMGQVIDAARIETPTLIIAAKSDRIVPPDSALGYVERNPSAKSIICETGHVGLLAGSKAEVQAWKPIANWCATHQ